MADLDQATLNYHYAKAQYRRLQRLEKENFQLRELLEKVRLYFLSKKQANKND